LTSRRAGRRTTRRSGSGANSRPRIAIAEATGDFAEDKDVAASIREERIRPEVEARHEVTVDFAGVTLVTQSFIHALISDVLRSAGEGALEYLVFDNCTQGVRGIIETVVQYSLETMESDEEEPPNKRLQPTTRASRTGTRRG
jgi:hypothetical protein